MKISWLGDGDFFEFTNLDKKLFRNLRVRKVSECSVLIEGEQSINLKENTWKDLGSNYSISCGAEVTRIKKPENEKCEKTKTQDNKPAKPKRGRPKKNKKV